MPSLPTYESMAHDGTESEEFVHLERQGSDLWRWPVAKPAFLIGAGLALAGAAAALLSGGGRAKRLVVGGIEEAVMLDEDPCADYSQISLVKVIQNNLGGKGPDAGDEGLVYDALDKVPGKADVPILVALNVQGDYSPAFPKDNGLNGLFGTFNVRGGTKVRVKWTILNKTTKEILVRPHQEISFFDLDLHKGDSTEFLQLSNFASFVCTKETELNISDQEDGSTTFLATTEGDGADNPSDPVVLTVQQKNRAVTVAYNNFTGAIFDAGCCTPGKSARYVSYVIRPALRCAKTKGAGQAEIVENSVTEAPNATGPTTVAPATAPEKKCWFYIGSWCFPKLF